MYGSSFRSLSAKFGKSALVPSSRYGSNDSIVRRGLATAASAPIAGKGKLPLAGIRVLDMSRILAGVCLITKHRGNLITSIASGRGGTVLANGDDLLFYSHIVHKFLEIWGMVHEALYEVSFCSSGILFFASVTYLPVSC